MANTKIRRLRPVALLLALAPALLAAHVAHAEPESGQKPFLRLRRDADGKMLALETKITRYEPKPNHPRDITVDLIGAIHVADRAYYDRLNELFTEYDVVLYELIADPDAQVPTRGQRRANPVSGLQLGMKHMLQLEFQLDCIDYAKPNMHHADLTPTEFTDSMKNRGENFVQMFFRMFRENLAVQATKPATFGDTRLLAALISKDRSHQLKRMLAEQFEASIGSASMWEGEEGSTLLSERNKRALKVLATELDAGKRSVAIFYGAAHMPDMEQRLMAKWKLQGAATRWLPAWSFTAPEVAGEAVISP